MFQWMAVHPGVCGYWTWWVAKEIKRGQENQEVRRNRDRGLRVRFGEAKGRQMWNYDHNTLHENLK